MKYACEGLNVNPNDPRTDRKDLMELVGDTAVMQKSPTADTRSATTPVDHGTLLTSSRLHIEDVRKVMKIYEETIAERAVHHDWTKIEYSDEFHRQFAHAQKTGDWPNGREWWYDKYHLTERHHLKDRVPKDVDLFDVLEMIADCTSAGMARSGQYRNDDPDNIKDILYDAYQNTIKKTLEKIKVIDPVTGV